MLIWCSLLFAPVVSNCAWDAAEPLDVECTRPALQALLEEFASRFSSGFSGEDAEVVMREISRASRGSTRLFEFTDVTIDGRSGPALAFVVHCSTENTVWLQFQRRGDLEFHEWIRAEFKKLVAEHLGTESE